jgi:hypothetical protein
VPPPPTDDWPSRPPREPPWHAGPGDPAEPVGPVPPRPPVPGRAAPPSPLVVGLIVTSVVLLLALTLTVAAIVRATGSDTAKPPPTSSAAGPSRKAPPAAAGGPACPPPEVAPAGPGGATGDAGALGAELDALKPFVERVRGHPFLRDVPVTILDPTAFREAIRAVYNEDRDAVSREGELLRAAGLVPPAYNVAAGGEQLIGDSALGFYDPRSARLVVRGEGHFSPYLRHVLVHELTHALDDQHFDLDRPELEDADDGRDWPFAALVEGTARWVDLQYRDCLSREDRAAFAEEERRFGLEQATALREMPLVLPRVMTTPYDYGQPFVQALVERGGTAALDTAFRQPPETSEQIADISRYYAGDAAQPVPVPPADGPVIDEGTLGSVMTALLLRGDDTNIMGALLDPSADGRQLAELMERLTRGEIDLTELFGDGANGGFGRLAGPEGWGGDRFVVYRVPPGNIPDVCVRADWRADSPAALEDLATRLAAWGKRDRRVQVSRPAEGVVRLTRCVGSP